MINKINIKYNNQVYIVWLNNRMFLHQPVYYTKNIPLTLTPQVYWYLHILHVLHQHGLLHSYTNTKKINLKKYE